MASSARLLLTLCVVCWCLAPGLGLAAENDQPKTELCKEADATKFVKEASGSSAQRARLIPPYNFLPAGETVSLASDRIYDEKVKVKVAFESLDPTDWVWPIDSAIARKISNDNLLITNHTLPDGSTLTVGVPTITEWWWRNGRVTVVGCDSSDQVVFVGQFDTVYSGFGIALLASLVATGMIYLFAALAVWRFEQPIRAEKDANGKQLKWYRYLDPVVLCSNSHSEGSLSRLQILFFSTLVFALLLYVLLRIGVLSEVSDTVLLLLGISAVGAASTKVAETQKQRLDGANYYWLISKGWLPKNGLAATNVAKWGDILTGPDGFDVYHFQMLIFSLVVGVALLRIGLTDLANFTIPTNLLAVLGLSQAVYLGGKIVEQPTMNSLNEGLKDLREKLEPDATAPGATQEAKAKYHTQLAWVITMFKAQFRNLPKTCMDALEQDLKSGTPSTQAPPVVTKINPTSGAEGTLVTVSGSGFTAATSLQFGEKPASEMKVSATEITAKSPAGTGTVDVGVVTPAGTSGTSSATKFTHNN